MERIPNSVENILRENELQEIENRNGWAFGTVVLVGSSGETNRKEEVLIELMPTFGGVRFMAEEENELMESYAYATRKAFEESSREVGWYVDSFDDPENPDYGKPSPW